MHYFEKHHYSYRSGLAQELTVPPEYVTHITASDVIVNLLRL